MMFRILLILALFPVFADAQKQEADSLFFEKAKSVVESFIRSDLGIGNGRVDLRAYNQFKELFDVKAMVEHDYNAVFQYNGNASPGSYIISNQPKPFDLYAHNVALQIKSIQIDSVGTIEQGENFDRNNMTYSIFRRVSVAKSRKYVLPGDYIDQVLKDRKIVFDESIDSMMAIDSLRAKTNDTATYFFTSSSILTITLVEHDGLSVKIKSIRSNNERIECHNDTDRDAVLQRDDLIPNWPGDFTSNGRPDYDLDGIPDAVKGVPLKIADRCEKTYGNAENQGCPMDYFLTKRSFDGFVGLQMNSAGINLPELNQLGYVDGSGINAMDVNQSSKGSLKNPGFKVGIHAGGNFAYYFGQKKRKTGMSVGATFTAFFADYSLTEPVIYTYKSDDSVNKYRRRVTIDSLNERIRYNIFNFPVMFSYRFFLRKKNTSNVNANETTSEGAGIKRSLINIKAGPSLMVFNTTSEYDALISFEGLYQTDMLGITYLPVYDTASPQNVNFTAASLIAQNPGRKPEDVFNELRKHNRNYDFAYRNNYRGEQKNESRLTVGINLDINFQYQISNEWSFRAGLQAVYAPLPERKEKYIPIDKTNDPYNSIYNSSAKSSYTAFGLNAGLVYNF